MTCTAAAAAAPGSSRVTKRFPTIRWWPATVLTTTSQPSPNALHCCLAACSEGKLRSAALVPTKDFPGKAMYKSGGNQRGQVKGKNASSLARRVPGDGPSRQASLIPPALFTASPQAFPLVKRPGQPVLQLACLVSKKVILKSAAIGGTEARKGGDSDNAAADQKALSTTKG